VGWGVAVDSDGSSVVLLLLLCFFFVVVVGGGGGGCASDKPKELTQIEICGVCV
jgi:hypothetical protein